MVPMPSDREKNAWPKAALTVLQVTLEKSGVRKKAMPLAAPSKVTARTARTITSRARTGIRMRAARSIPPRTPPATITRVSTMKAA